MVDPSACEECNHLSIGSILISNRRSNLDKRSLGNRNRAKLKQCPKRYRENCGTQTQPLPTVVNIHVLVIEKLRRNMQQKEVCKRCSSIF
jgi:hypothetical protein